MTVKELIEKLGQFDPNTMVIRSGYEDGVSEVSEAKPVKITLNVNTEWYYGPHAIEPDSVVPAVFIH